MSDNVEMVQGAYEAFGRGDIPALMANFADDIEWHSPEPLPQHMDACGPEEVGQFFQAVPDRADAVGHGAGKLDGDDAEYGFVHAWTVRDGKLTRFNEYVAPSGALVAK